MKGALMLRWFTIVLALVGLAIGIFAVASGKQQLPEVPLARPASVNPFGRGVAALGIVEPAGRVVEIAAPEPGLVTDVYVNVGDVVKKGQPLMKLDSRSIESQIIKARGDLKARQSEVDRWHAIPRAEDVPPLEAAVMRARATLADAEDKKQRATEAIKTHAMSARDLAAADAAAEVARAELASAEADLARLKAGGWKADLEVATANLEATGAQIESLELLKDRLTVRATRDGTVLRRDVEPGEYVLGFTPAAQAQLVIGDLSHLNVRAQVDEEDIALVGPDSKAVGRTRGAVQKEITLRLLRIEPYARPKTDLSGANSERTDTRVVDVVLEIVPDGKSAYTVVPGQAVDVFLDAAK